jgi:hypothetical protein
VSGRGYYIAVFSILRLPHPLYPLPGTWPTFSLRSLQLTPTSSASLYSYTSLNKALTWYYNVPIMSLYSSPGSGLKSYPTIDPPFLLVKVEVYRLYARIANS